MTWMVLQDGEGGGMGRVGVGRVGARRAGARRAYKSRPYIWGMLGIFLGQDENCAARIDVLSRSLELPYN
jgi:hypothetical protein